MNPPPPQRKKPARTNPKNKGSTKSPRRRFSKPKAALTLDDSMDGSVYMGGGMTPGLAVQDDFEDEARFERGCRLLMLIAKTSRQGLALAMLDESPDLVNFRDYDRRTPLHVASSEGNTTIAKHLVERGARLNRSDRWGGSALDDALRHNHKDMVAYLRSINARHGVRSNLAELIAAAAAGDEVEVRALLDDGTSPNGGDYDKRTPLHLAAGEAHRNIVDLLLERGATVNAADRWNNTPLDDALRLDFARGATIVAALKARGAVADREKERKDVSHHASGVVVNSRSAASVLEVHWSDIELLDRLGGGSFGDVYRASWKQTPVAAKSLKKLATDRERALALADFEVEANILQNLRHPNICLMLGFSTEPGKEVLIQELMTCSLFEVLRTARLQERPIPRKRGLRYMLELARGMHYLHSCEPPVLHRDLKPANLLLDAANTLRISDFGLATLRKTSTHQPTPSRQRTMTEDVEVFDPEDDGEHLDLTGHTGSPRFMAPEVYMCQPYGRPVDVYSFSMIAYNVLEMRAPWPHLQGDAAVRRACDGERPPISRNVDRRISGLMSDCWRDEAGTRPSFAAILDILKGFEAEGGEIERPLDATKILKLTNAANAGCQCVLS